MVEEEEEEEEEKVEFYYLHSISSWHVEYYYQRTTRSRWRRRRRGRNAPENFTLSIIHIILTVADPTSVEKRKRYWRRRRRRVGIKLNANWRCTLWAGCILNLHLICQAPPTTGSSLSYKVVGRLSKPSSTFSRIIILQLGLSFIPLQEDEDSICLLHYILTCLRGI